MDAVDGSMIEVIVSSASTDAEPTPTLADLADWRAFLAAALAVDFPKAAINVIIGDVPAVEIRAWHATDDERAQSPASTRMNAQVHLACERAWSAWQRERGATAAR